MARETGEVRVSLSAGIRVCSCPQRLLRQCEEDYWTGTKTCLMCAAFILTYMSGSFHPKMKTKKWEILFCLKKITHIYSHRHVNTCMIFHPKHALESTADSVGIFMLLYPLSSSPGSLQPWH